MVAYVLEGKLVAARGFRPTVNLSGRFGAEGPGAMLDKAPGTWPHRAPATRSSSKRWLLARFGRERDLFS